jgi:UDP-N-acetylglucosamine-peptide-n-acetylglucosaminyltransferase
MMDVNGLISAASQFFNEKKYAEAIEKLHQAWDGITDKSIQITEQSWIQSGLGRCYFEQAIKTKDTDKADELFGKAVKHYQEWSRLAKTDGQNSIQQQINAQSWLGRCFLEQARRIKDADKADKRFGQAVKCYEEWLQLAKQLTDEQGSVQQQINAQSWLGHCYFERIKRIKSTPEAEKFVTQASKYFSAAFRQIAQINDEREQEKLKKGIYPYLRDIDYLNEDWDSYFKKKKQETQESLFKGETSQPQDAVATVLAVLHIPPIELGSIPLAHYTSPHVCHKLFGIGGNDTASPMRIGSSTYMNDPSEGRGLLDLLNQQDLELENKADGASHNAFFTCFSSRVNDLNQFRLYGKEDGVEASGCCLVFNKNGDWLKEADVSVPFRSLSQKSGQDSDGLPEAGFSGDEYEKLPLYQVAYIAYKDEYIADKKCGIWFPSQAEPKFGIRLKPVGNEKWHQFRLEKLKEALEELIGFFEDKSVVSDDDKEALEYIRYLFKDFAFRDEEEFRLLVIKPIDSEEIEYCETTQSVYIPYADIRNRADEVILGTNYEKTGNQRKAEVFRYQMKQKCPDVKVSRSTLPINPPNKLNQPNK